MKTAIPEAPHLSDDSEHKHNNFCHITDAITSWDENRRVAMLIAYCDASVREKSKVFCVAGLAFGPDRAKKLDREWRKLFGAKVCHMTDLHAGRGEFADTPKHETTRLHKEAIRLIGEYVSVGVAASIDVAEADRVLPKSAPVGREVALDGWRTPYAVCASAVMVGLGWLAKPNTGIAYMFEAGDAFQSESNRFIRDFSQSGRPKSFQQYLSHAYMTKADATLLQAADVFAWEWAKHVEQATAATGPKLLARPGLQALIKADGQMPGATLRRETDHFIVRHLELTDSVEKLKESIGLR